LVYLLVLFPNSYTILFWEFCLLPFSVHVQTLLGEGHSKIKPRLDDALEAVAKAGHLRE
jgi:hypothetical protein